MEDYVSYKLKARLKLKEVDKQLLKNDFTGAVAGIEEAIVELRLTKAAITDLNERINIIKDIHYRIV